MQYTNNKKEGGEINGSTNFLQREQAQGYRNSISPGAAVGAIRIRKRRLHRNDRGEVRLRRNQRKADADRKSTRLNSSHVAISYAVFCLKKKKRTKQSVR